MAEPGVREADRGSVAELDRLRQEAAGCRNCPLWEIGTQTVFGAGPVTARVMLIGEAPGASEDQQGVPFVGAAGALLEEALAAAGLERAALYITNTVKHRPWQRVGNREKNRPPKQSEINACRPWLEGELGLLRPAIIGCLGAVAARAILGKEFRLMTDRGTWHSAEAAPHVLATVHPSFVLIQPKESHDRWRETLFADLRAIAERARSLR